MLNYTNSGLLVIWFISVNVCIIGVVDLHHFHPAHL